MTHARAGTTPSAAPPAVSSEVPSAVPLASGAAHAALVTDVLVVGGGPCGATAADDLARAGVDVTLVDRAGRIKPCGGAIPPQALVDFELPRDVLEAEISCARMISPSARAVDMPIDSGFVGMVDRGSFDEWLRARAAGSGARRLTATFRAFADDGATGADGRVGVRLRTDDDGDVVVRARYVLGADGANTRVGRAAVPGSERMKRVHAYHEIVAAPGAGDASAAVGGAATDGPLKTDAARCDVVYDGALSPDFYSWVFPHGDVVSVGTGSAVKGFGLRGSVTELRRRSGLDAARTIRTEGAPIPMKPLKRWDDGRHVLLAGDAAGVVAPSSGEGIYYAMACGRIAATTVAEALAGAGPAHLKLARKRFLRAHGKVFLVLGIMQRFWYSSDARRERFVTMCEDADVQRLTWEAYLNKKLVRRDPMAHVRIFWKDTLHLLGLAREEGDGARARPASASGESGAAP